MIVTFRTSAHANVTYLGDVALGLLAAMGRDEKIPSAMYAEDVPEALRRLKAAMDEESTRLSTGESADGDDDGDEPVGFRQRALPLIELLEAAQKENKNVMWDSN